MNIFFLFLQMKFCKTDDTLDYAKPLSTPRFT